MNSADYAALASLMAVLVSILGWFFTHRKQEQLENLKGDIAEILSEHDTRFAFLHKRRGIVIDEVYKKFDELIRLLEPISSGEGLIAIDSMEEKLMEKAVDMFHELRVFYFQNRLFLDRELCNQIEKGLKSTSDIFAKYGTVWTAVTVVSNDLNRLEQYEQLSQMVRDDIRNNLQPIRSSIEAEMRSILGIDTKPKSRIELSDEIKDDQSRLHR